MVQNISQEAKDIIYDVYSRVIVVHELKKHFQNVGFFALLQETSKMACRNWTHDIDKSPWRQLKDAKMSLE